MQRGGCRSFGERRSADDRGEHTTARTAHHEVLRSGRGPSAHSPVNCDDLVDQTVARRLQPLWSSSLFNGIVVYRLALEWPPHRCLTGAEAGRGWLGVVTARSTRSRSASILRPFRYRVDDGLIRFRRPARRDRAGLPVRLLGKTAVGASAVEDHRYRSEDRAHDEANNQPRHHCGSS